MFVTVIILKLVILIKGVIIFKVDQLTGSFKHFCFNIIIIVLCKCILKCGPLCIQSVYDVYK